MNGVSRLRGADSEYSKGQQGGWSISILGELREGKEIGDDREDGEFREERIWSMLWGGMQ